VSARRRDLGELDALLAIVPLPATAAAFRRLPESARWRELDARAPAWAATVRTTVLSNHRQTLAVLGYLKDDASAFERLSLAGRMLKESAARNPQTVGLTASGTAAAARAALEALLAAALVHAFALPSFRAPARHERHVRRIVLLGGHSVDTRYAAAAARGTNLARWLTALPPNVLDARGYRHALGTLARRHRVTLRWLDERALRRAGANAFLAVAAGNSQGGAGIAHLKYRPARHRRRGARPDIALIGKGILFDTGGVNLKTHRSMLDMHTDMAGSAVALATLLALAELRAPLAARTQPRFMIDFATLTGACVYSLTERMSGVFANRPQLAAKLCEAGRASGERVWNFPFESDYDSELESKAADVLQCTLDGKGDHIFATRFLARFVPPGLPWAHVDLSSATRSGGLAHVGTDVTGFGVRFALELILGQKVLDALA
jgi:leucyl aminopeptidase